MTDEQLGYRRINAGVCMFHQYIKIKDGKQEWNPYFIEHVNDCNALFIELYKDKIIAAVGETGWAINFVQFSQESVTWLVDLYLDNVDLFPTIAGIIQSNVPKDMVFNYYHRGSLLSYTQIR